jgi:hypothetical protein
VFRIVMPFPPGGTAADSVARVIAAAPISQLSVRSTISSVSSTSMAKYLTLELRLLKQQPDCPQVLIECVP